MRLLCIFFICIAGCGAIDGSRTPWTGAWGGNQITLWLMATGDFVSKEVPVAESKPSGNTILKGQWTVLADRIRLNITYEANVLGPESDAYYVNIRRQHFTTDLFTNSDKKALSLRQLHLTPLAGDSRAFEYTLSRLKPEPPAFNWDKLQERATYLHDMKPGMMLRAVPGGVKGKIYR